MYENTLKQPHQKFNLLYLSYNEHLFNSIKVYAHRADCKNNNIEKGMLHINSNSLIFDADEIQTPLLKLLFSGNLYLKSYKFKELVDFYNKHLEFFNKESKKNNVTTNASNLTLKRGSRIHNNSRVGESYSNIHATYRDYQGNTSNLNQQNPSSLNFTKRQKNTVGGYTGIYTNKATFKISQFGSLLNKALNHNGPTAATQNNLPIYSQSSVGEQSGMQNIHSVRNNKRTYNYFNLSLLHNGAFSDLYNYFQENNLNISEFGEIFFNINNTFSLADKENYSYSVIIVKTSELITMPRDQIDKYEKEPNEQNNFMFIVEGNASEIDNFINDVTVFTEGLKNHDENSLVDIITDRKIDELREKFVIENQSISAFENNSLEVRDKMTEDKLDCKTVNFYCRATRILPEKLQVGLFVIHPPETNKYSVCEFIPVTNDFKKKSLKFNLIQIKAFLEFRFMYRYKAINFFLYSKHRSKIIDFESEKDFHEVYEFFKINCPKLDNTYADIKYHTNLWVDGLMSNYDYLMYLNIMGGRSFGDLSQYPIMPWVITNYEDEETLDLNDSKNYRDLSKPIGALNQKRLKSLHDNYQELKEQGKEFPFLYGTYYSIPYIVIYYLIRERPGFFLRFQDGNFGPTDRLFYSIKECWNNSLNNPGSQDVKELIPEFYNSEGEFLKNFHNLDFGRTQNGVNVNDVILPKWAKSCKDFVNIMRTALESEIVSNSLHHWIDLVFGYKQRGERALEADNLFHYLRYDDNLNLVMEKIDDEKISDLDNIIEYGQVPITLFNNPHPKKRSKLILNDELISKTTLTGYEPTSASGPPSYLVKVNKCKKERINIEKKYEKQRRNKEQEIDEINRTLEEKEQNIFKQLNEMNSTFYTKEIEFRAYVSKLNEQNMELKKIFNNYDKYKDVLYKKWIRDVKAKHDKELQGRFSDKINLYKHIKNMEQTVSSQKLKLSQLSQTNVGIQNQIKLSSQTNLMLKQEYYEIQKEIRNLPPEKQIYLTRKGKVSHERGMFRGLKGSNVI